MGDFLLHIKNVDFLLTFKCPAECQHCSYKAGPNRTGFIKQKEELNLVRKNVNDLEIRTSALTDLISTLSGGNQQKVVFGKWLNMNPKVLILDEPTRGIDVGAKAEIREIIDHLAGEGKAILLISSELPEILGMSDRVMVMREGSLVGEYARQDCSEEILGYAAAGINMNT